MKNKKHKEAKMNKKIRDKISTINRFNNGYINKRIKRMANIKIDDVIKEKDKYPRLKTFASNRNLPAGKRKMFSSRKVGKINRESSITSIKKAQMDSHKMVMLANQSTYKAMSIQNIMKGSTFHKQNSNLYSNENVMRLNSNFEKRKMNEMEHLSPQGTLISKSQPFSLKRKKSKFKENSQYEGGEENVE
mmetsp:Transcript_19346/g.17156  ORF Transcript_19346/g.17156 Transcript_19346/m.17156 type:complete len:190 (+) Transcript_19346:1069-1638(+)